MIGRNTLLDTLKKLLSDFWGLLAGQSEKTTTETCTSSGKKLTKPGEWSFLESANGDITGMMFRCPCGCGETVFVKFGEKEWWWDGRKNKPTLSPSINRTNGCGWHGFLKKGEWQSVGCDDGVKKEYLLSDDADQWWY